MLAMVWLNLIHTFSTLFVLYLKKGTLGYSLNCLNGLRNFGKKYTHTPIFAISLIRGLCLMMLAVDYTIWRAAAKSFVKEEGIFLVNDKFA